MTVENSVETYQFTCIRCATRWISRYEVSQVNDDEGATRSFYRHHGAPCEAPVGGNIECPRCHATKAVRDPLYGTGPAFAPDDLADLADLAVPVPGQPAAPADAPVLVRHSVAGTWHRFRFSAVVTLDTAGRSRQEYLSGVPGLLVRVPSCQRPTLQQYFPAVFSTGDDRPLRPGDKGVPVMVSVPDDDASGFFQCGQHFTVWDGKDIGHGTVAQRVFFGSP